MRGKFLITLLISTCCVVDTGLASDVAKRVQPPAWSKDVLDAFFDDARDHLVGPRPARESHGRESGNKLPVSNITSTDSASTGAFRWSQLIDGETLIAEVKRINLQLNLTARKSQSMVRGTDEIFARDFALLSVIFQVLAEYDEDVRWKEIALAYRQKAREASRAFQDISQSRMETLKEMNFLLEDLMRGQPSPSGEILSDDASELVDRPLLMQAMEVALNERLSSALANAREFRRRSQLAAEQAQLLAMLAEVIQRDGYEYSDDDEFLAEARLLRSASEELAQAAKDKNYEAARTAAGRVSQSCSRCHEGYRG